MRRYDLRPHKTDIKAYNKTSRKRIEGVCHNAVKVQEGDATMFTKAAVFVWAINFINSFSERTPGDNDGCFFNFISE